MKHDVMTHSIIASGKGRYDRSLDCVPMRAAALGVFHRCSTHCWWYLSYTTDQLRSPRLAADARMNMMIVHPRETWRILSARPYAQVMSKVWSDHATLEGMTPRAILGEDDRVDSSPIARRTTMCLCVSL